MRAYKVSYRVTGSGEVTVDANSTEEAWDKFAEMMEDEDKVRETLERVEIDYQNIDIERDTFEEDGGNDY